MQTHLVEKVRSYNFSVHYVPGKKNNIADTLSRQPLFNKNHEEETEVEEGEHVRKCEVDTDLKWLDMEEGEECLEIKIRKEKVPNISLEDNYKAAEEDEEYKLMIKALKEGIGTKETSDNHPLRNLGSVIDDISILQNKKKQEIIVKDARCIFVPKRERGKIIKMLHEPHIGWKNTWDEARKLFFWTEMKNNIRQECEECEACLKFSRSKAKERQEKERINLATMRPHDYYSTDHFAVGREDFLCTVDRATSYIWVYKVRDHSSVEVIRCFDEVCTRPTFSPTMPRHLCLRR